MNFIYTPLPAERTEQFRVGVAVFVADPAVDQLHVGVLYAPPREPLKFLHLAFHARLKDEPFWGAGFRQDRPYVGVAPNIDAELLPSVVAVCRRVVTRSQREIPYGVLYEGGRFLESGQLELAGEAHGLTCATFVLHIFESAGATLLDIASWESREEDGVWHDRIVDALRNFQLAHPTEITDEHIAAVAAERGCARIRPEEVVGGADSNDLPAAFHDARQRGAAVRARLAAEIGP
ncbi:MAG: hypothetical protein Q8P41_18245 [Pseudomonadota bacterium]|nr:hypothetical protein [Pseudomonadota bacterium]